MRANFAAASDRLIIVEAKRSQLKQKRKEVEQCWKIERTQFESMLERCREMLVERERECQDTRNQLNERNEDMQSDMESEIEGLKAAIEGLQAALGDERQQKKACEQMRQALEKQLRGSEQCALELKEHSALLEERCTSLQSTILRLESEADSWRPNLRQVQASLQESESSGAFAKAEVATLRREVMRIKEELADADQRASQLSEELKHSAVSIRTDFAPTARLHVQVRILSSLLWRA
jgi:chromosome segregation ATPase